MMDPQVRVGDADRDETVAALQKYVAEGYLTMDEFDQRSAAAYRAKTRGELAAVTTDLARTGQAPPAEPDRMTGCGPRMQRQGGSSMPVAAVVGLVGVAAFVGLMIVMMVIMMLSGGMGGMMGGMR